MTQIPVGWYPDPAAGEPGMPGAPNGQRYWDGTQWTEHVAPGAFPGYGGAPGVSPRGKTTPDGQPLAGWWHRVGASLLDVVIQTPLMALVAAPVIWWQWDAIMDSVRATVDASAAGLAQPTEPAVFSAWSGPMIVLTLLMMLTSAAYTLGFWHWKQATPGKLIVGLRLRRRDVPGPMPWSTMAVRFAVVNVLVLAGDNDPVYWTLVLLLLVDYLWPLWDDKNQALHDKLARTNVVMRQSQE
ncbi:MAG: RDD family protein [Nocardioidaceae bacterium]